MSVQASENREDFATVAAAARACQLCAPQLAHGVRPVFQGSATARILIAGQAPGVRVHTSGLPFDDASGERLRAWLGLARDVFYDASRIAIVPMGFCFPGSGKSGDLPPRRECAPLWRARLLAAMPDIRLTILLGQYAAAWHVPHSGKAPLGALVAEWRQHLPALVVLPHPSPRNALWLHRHPWVEADIVPALQTRVRTVLG